MAKKVLLSVNRFDGMMSNTGVQNLPDGVCETLQNADPTMRNALCVRRGLAHAGLTELTDGVGAVGYAEVPGGAVAMLQDAYFAYALTDEADIYEVLPATSSTIKGIRIGEGGSYLHRDWLEDDKRRHFTFTYV